MSQGGSTTKDVPVCIGGTVKLEIRATDPPSNSGSANSVTIAITKQPSSSPNLSIGPNEYPDENNKNTVFRVIEYKPQHSIDNYEADDQICFTATDNNNGEGTGSRTASERCVNIQKRYYPRFMDKTPEQDTNFLTYINNEVSFTIVAEDQNTFDSVKIMVDEDPGLPNGAVVEQQTCGGVGAQSDNNEEGGQAVACNPAS